MKTLNELLTELNACIDAREWAEDKTIEEVVKECHRGDWLLWLAAKVDIELKLLMLARYHCANTVRHLIKDERGLKALEVAYSFSQNKATIAELYSASCVYATYTASAYTAYCADASAEDIKKNRQETADLCREHIGELIIKKVNELLITN